LDLIQVSGEHPQPPTLQEVDEVEKIPPSDMTGVDVNRTLRIAAVGVAEGFPPLVRHSEMITYCTDRDLVATPVREPREEPEIRGAFPAACDFNGRGVTFLVVGDVTLQRGMKYLFAASLHLRRP
jgi:hypothetical protein